MNLYNRKKHKFFDICSVERAKKGKVYNKGCVCLQCSATKGQTKFLDSDQEVEGKYAVIELNDSSINPEYFYLIFKDNIADYLNKYQIGLNIKPDLLKYMELELHSDIETQIYIVNLMKKMETRQRQQEQIIQELKNFKQYYLDNMFVQKCGDNKNEES